MADSQKIEPCPICSAKMERILTPANVTGTRDNFGVKNAFYDPESGKEITTFKEWSAAGYKQAKDTNRSKSSARAKAAFQRKKDKLKGKITV